ncbi:MAG: NAD-dependent epimerase/dehydratase family protein [Pseudonocardiaceae bacterium]
MADRAAAFTGRPVLVTGATGFLGARLVERLVAGGAQVYAVRRHGTPSQDKSIQDKSIRWAHLDLADATATADLIASIRPVVVFHLAGEVTGAREVDLVLPVFRNTLHSTVNVLTAVAGHGRGRVVLAGSLEEAGIGEEGTPPSSPYAVAKWAATAYAAMFRALWASEIVTLRISMAYGPGQHDRRKLVPYVIDSLLQGRAPRLTSGTRRVDWVYVDDVVEAFLAAAATPDASAVMDIGSGSSTSIGDVVRMIANILDVDVEPDFGALPDRPHDRDRLADLTAARTLLGWKPTVGLPEGLSATVNWYRRTQSHDRARRAAGRANETYNTGREGPMNKGTDAGLLGEVRGQ